MAAHDDDERTAPSAERAPLFDRRISDLLLDVRHTPSVDAVIDRLCERLAAGGVPVWRSSTMVPTRHPEVFGRTYYWVRGEGSRSVVHEHAIVETPSYQGSPIEAIHLGSGPIRVRRDDSSRRVFPGVEELFAKGATDYVMFPLAFRNVISGVSWATDAAAGFSDEHMRAFEGLLPALSIRLELESSYFATESLLETYLGRNAARRVFAGDVRRGTGESIHAAIWFCDMRDFTAIGDRLRPSELVALLDRYFEKLAGPIEDHGGEILKFVGDAALAVFPTGAGVGERDACRRALESAEAALAAVDISMSIGIAMHVGEVLFGNIGARNRLDFTVIGAAVNTTSRLQSLCRSLGVPLVMSRAFADAAGREAQSLGSHVVRGVSEPVEVMTLPAFVRR